ncbi:MAG: thioredoxin family protein [Pirellulaceae bacterium]|nr:thioredoxin family protein [Pirellulaceae bacterium]
MNNSNPTSNKGWSSGWTIAVLVLVFAAFQSSSLKELYYSVAGVKFPESTIEWRHDLESALTEAQAQERPVLLVFGATWCPPCKKMKREVWPDAKVAEAVAAGFVPVYVDVDDEAQAQVAAHYRVSTIPAVLVLDSSGTVTQQRSLMSVSQTQEFLAASRH